MFSYDRGRSAVARVDQDGNVLSYSYDGAGRLARLTDGSGSLIASYAYDPSGRLVTKTLGNGVYSTYGYDAAGNLVSLVNLQARRFGPLAVSTIRTTPSAVGLR